MSKVYIAGKITGDDRYYEKFAKVERELDAQGHSVLNPAELPEGMTPRDYMSICVQMVLSADMVMALPDWEESKGAIIEISLAQYIGLPVCRYSDG